ncbi:alkaline phosphatase D family protein [Microbispora sp. H13382]|uniref:alkaline phosphatase D family protein n=1 Tax=Microbispora sp. H13382 TaxID=2729112 RepID=UPI0028736BD2|nr:alkaline phosphatase D family protein [Microbispora sp. H13382]
MSAAGRTRTAPAGMSPLRFAVAACAHWEHGYDTAYRRLAEQEPDLVVHLGDYIYEYEPQGYTALGQTAREHAGAKCRTLADYRVRHAQYKSDHDLQAAHLVAPWLVAFDDHEIENNWAGPASSSQAPEFRDAGAVPHARVHQPPGAPRQGLGGEFTIPSGHAALQP